MADPTADDILDDLSAAGDLTIADAQKGDERISRRSGKDLMDVAAFLQQQAARTAAAPTRVYAKRGRTN